MHRHRRTLAILEGLSRPAVSHYKSHQYQKVIQLFKAAGFEVITTCSAQNFEYVKHLGADKPSIIKTRP